MSKQHCEELARCRRRLQQIPKKKVVILDETHVRVGSCDSHTLVAPGESSCVVVENTTRYAPRYDMIACTSFTHTLPPIVYTPADRQQRGVDGVNERMFLDYIIITDILAPAIASLDEYPITLVMDKSNIHHPDKIKLALIDGGCQDVADIIILPTQAAKRMSPLDNSLFHTWKQNILRRGATRSSSLVQVMCDEWNNLTRDIIHQQYQHCLIMRQQNVYADCPDTHAHQHVTA